jgi:hypothetical protein
MQFIKTKFYLNEDDETVTADIFNNGVFMHTLKFSYEIKFYQIQADLFQYRANVELINKNDELFFIGCDSSDGLLISEPTSRFEYVLKEKALTFIHHQLELSKTYNRQELDDNE